MNYDYRPARQNYLAHSTVLLLFLFSGVFFGISGFMPGGSVMWQILGLALLLLLTAGLLFLRRKKTVSLVRRIIGFVLVAIILFGCLIGAKMVKDAYDTLHKVTVVPSDIDEEGVCVFVREDDPAQALEDTASYTYAIIAEHDEELIAKATDIIETQVGKTLAMTLYEDSMLLADALLHKDADAILVNSAVIVALSEEEGYTDILEKLRVLHSFPINELEETEPTEPPTEPVNSITQEPFVVYLTGSDTRSKKLNKSRSDVNILAIVNPKTKQVLLVNTPRDYYVPNPKGKGKLDKLTNCGLYGPENSMKTLSDLYDVSVDYYAQINFEGVKTLVDAIGGVTVVSTQSFTCGDLREFKIVKGENHLNGEEALAFARERYHVKGGDNGRGKNQMRVITAIIKKATTGTTIISNYSQILGSMEGMFRTSVPMENVSALVKMQLDDMATWDIKSFAVTGEGDSQKTYSAPGHKSYVMHPHKYMVNHAQTLIEKVISGQILTDADMKVNK